MQQCDGLEDDMELKGSGAHTPEYYAEVEALKPELDKRRNRAKQQQEKQAAVMAQLVNNQKPVS